MVSLNTLRTKFGTLLSIVIAFALLAFILSLKTDMGFSNNDPKVGEIDGDKIRYSEYLDAYDKVKERNGGAEATSDEQQTQMTMAVWQTLFTNHVLKPGFERMGIAVPETERLALVRGEIPSQTFFSIFGNPRTGQYDVDAVTQFLVQAGNDPRTQGIWNDLNEQARTERSVQKYLTLLGKGVYANRLELDKGVEHANKVFAGKFAAKKYNTVPDSLVSVTSADIEKFYADHKESFRQAPTRSLSYVVFEVAATDEDQLALENEVRKVGDEFAVTDDIKGFVRQNRYGEMGAGYLSAAQLADDQAEKLKTGAMFGPELKNDVWTMARVAETKMAPDSLGLRLIVLPYTQDKLADSLLNVARGGASFEELARNYAANEELAANGGQLGVVPFSVFDSQIAEALADAKVGDVVKLVNGNTIQLFNVYRADKPSTHYKVATLRYPVEASSATVREVHNQASTFCVNAKGKMSDFNAAAEAAAVTPRVATISMGERTLRGVEHSRDIVRWAYGAEPGDLSEIFRVGKDYVVAVLTEVDDAEYTDLEKVAPQIRSRLMLDRKFDYLKSQLQGSTLEEAARSLGVETEDFKDLSYNSYFVEGIGMEPAVIGAVSAAPQTGVLSAPVKGAGGLYVFVVDSVADREEPQTPDAEKVRLEAMSENVFQQGILPALQQMSKIKDLGGRYF